MVDQVKKTSLKKSLNLLSLTFYGVGLIIGAGIYSVIGEAAGLAKEGLWLSFLLGATLALLTALSYAELTTRYPTAGAEYVYAQKAFPDLKWLSFLLGFILLLAGTATATTVAMAFAGYLKSLADFPTLVSAGGLLILCGTLSILALKVSSLTNIVFTVIEVTGLLIVIYFGMSTKDFLEPLSTPLSQQLHPGILASAALIFFVYLGFEEIANLAEETKNPRRTLPFSIFLSLGIATTLYVLVSLAVLALSSPEALSQSSSPLSLVLQNTSPRMGTFLGVVALFATSNTALITIVALSRMVFAMARNGALPKVFAKVSRGGNAPWTATLLVVGFCFLLLPLGSLEILAGISSFGALVGFSMIHVFLIVLRFKEPSATYHFKVPLSIGKLPLFPLTGLIASILFLTQFERQVYVVGGVAILLSFLVYGVLTRLRRHPNSSTGPIKVI